MNKLAKLSRRGFSVVEVVVIVAIVGVIGAAGFMVYSRQSDSAKDTNTSEQVADDVPAINSTEDLDAASQAVDDTNIDAVDAELQGLDEELTEI